MIKNSDGDNKGQYSILVANDYLEINILGELQILTYKHTTGIPCVEFPSHKTWELAQLESQKPKQNGCLWGKEVLSSNFHLSNWLAN